MKLFLIILINILTLIHAKAQLAVDFKFFDGCEQKVKSLSYRLDSFDTLIYIPADSIIKVDSGFYILETTLERGDYYHSFLFHLVLSKTYYSDTLYLNKISSGWDGVNHPRQTVFHFDCMTICDGELTETDTKGRVRAKGKFQNGKPFGKLDYYDAKGNLMSRAIYRNGNLKKFKKIRIITGSN